MRHGGWQSVIDVYVNVNCGRSPLPAPAWHYRTTTVRSVGTGIACLQSSRTPPAAELAGWLRAHGNAAAPSGWRLLG
jgi:hypothetical protein